MSVSTDTSPLSTGMIDTNTASNSWIKVFVLCFLTLVGYGVANVILPYTMTSIQADFGLTGTQTGAIITIFVIGHFIGGFIGGWATDNYGRVKVLVTSMIISSIFFSVLSITQSYIQYMTLLFIGSVFLGPIYMACNVLLSETIDAKYRSRAMSTLMVGFIVGAIITALIAGQILADHGWRPMYYLCLFPIIIGILIKLLVKENQSWVETKKSNALNKVKQENPYLIILKNKTYLKMFLIWTFCAGFLQFGYMGLSSWLPTYFEKNLNLTFQNMTLYMVLTYTCSIMTKLVAGTLADKWGRRAIFGLGTVGTAVCLSILILFNTPSNSIALIILYSLFFGIPFGIVTTYMVESFPTSIRGTAVGGSYNIGAGLSAIAPMLVGYFAEAGSLSTGIFLMGGAYLVTGIIAMLLIKDRLYDTKDAV
ncbi:MFS transporter [Acinetobacter baumannii]|uniref:MFS transporter n=1 Tax=Acinetobacter baumannii TaxID=470 RepID=UPI002449F895|nr:MFS transporter [Acinetobacter baumannii]MDH2528311.1 MFS transporter [Acinetobacter baumannii]